MKILIDADACPRNVLQICLRLGKEKGFEVWTVANVNHAIQCDRHVVVGDNPQEADIKVINLTESQDVIVTQDYGLAAMVLGKGAFCISPDGKEYTPNNIGFLLEVRDAGARIRRAGGKTKGPSKRTIEDDRRFEQSLLQILSR